MKFEGTMSYIGIGSDYLDIIPKVQATKEKIDKGNIKL